MCLREKKKVENQLTLTCPFTSPECHNAFLRSNPGPVSESTSWEQEIPNKQLQCSYIEPQVLKSAHCSADQKKWRLWKGAALLINDFNRTEILLVLKKQEFRRRGVPKDVDHSFWNCNMSNWLMEHSIIYMAFELTIRLWARERII